MTPIRCNRYHFVRYHFAGTVLTAWALAQTPALATDLDSTLLAPGQSSPAISTRAVASPEVSDASVSDPSVSDPSVSDPLAPIVITGRQLMPRIVRVQARDANGRINIGSGVPISPDLVATNCHVTRRARTIELMIMTPYGPVQLPVVKQAGSPERDVCLLRTSQTLPMPPVGIGEIPQRGEAVVAIGFSGGINLRMHIGEVTSLHPFEGAQVIQTTTAFDSGASGGGLFTADGRLVGLITFRSQFGEPRYFSAPVQWIKAIQSTQAFKPIAPNPAARAFWEQSTAALPAFLQSDLAAASKSARLAPINAE